MTLAAAFVLAWLADACFGEPPDRWHPVAWFGRLATRVGRGLPALRPAPAFAAGALAWTLLVGGAAGLGVALVAAVATAPAWIAVPVLALALKPAFAWRMLRDEVAATEDAFDAGLDAARARVARLCSRDVSTLDETAIRETAIETLAENTNDSVVAPLFWLAVAGLPGAWAWRAANTLDAMWGYRGRWEWAGKWSARADDLLAAIPARLTAAAWWRASTGWRRLRDEAARTPSPNGGWPMGAMALRLGVCLRKPGVYLLNPDGHPADRAATRRALALAGRAAWCAAALTLLALLAQART